MSYASSKGRGSASLKPLNRAPLPELSDAEKEAVAAKARLVKEHMPDCWEFMKSLQAEGMIDGMRCIESVTVFEGKDHGQSV